MHRIYIAGAPIDVPDTVLDGTPLTAAQKSKMTKAQARRPPVPSCMPACRAAAGARPPPPHQQQSHSLPSAWLTSTPLQAAAITEYQRVSDALWVVSWAARMLALAWLAAARRPCWGLHGGSARGSARSLPHLLTAARHCCGQDDCGALEGAQCRCAGQRDLPELVSRGVGAKPC